jgi:mono/diheme cytochrome c family protein
MHIMNQKVIIISAMLLVTTTVFGCGRNAPLNEDSVARGKYLVTLGGCNDCHTPKLPGPGGAPELDVNRLLAGHPENAPSPVWTPEDAKRNVLVTVNDMGTAWAGPWGVSFASNLTPDKETGIEEWSEATFSPDGENRQTSRSTQRSRYFAADAVVQCERLDGGRPEGNVGVPAKHSAGEKSGTVPDPAADFSKSRSRTK